MEFFTTVAPGLGAVLIAIAGWLQQYLKSQHQQKTTDTLQEAARESETKIRNLHSQISFLEENEERHERMDRERRAEIRDLTQKVESCERKSTRLESEVDNSKMKVQELQTTNATLNIRMATLIQELESLNAALKDQTIKLRREPAIL